MVILAVEITGNFSATVRLKKVKSVNSDYMWVKKARILAYLDCQQGFM